MAEPLDLLPIQARDALLVFPHVTTAAIDRRALLAEVERLRNTEAWDEVERLRDELGRQYAKINAVWELMQQTPFSQDIAKADLVNALVEGGNPT